MLLSLRATADPTREGGPPPETRLPIVIDSLLVRLTTILAPTALPIITDSLRVLLALEPSPNAITVNTGIQVRLAHDQSSRIGVVTGPLKVQANFAAVRVFTDLQVRLTAAVAANRIEVKTGPLNVLLTMAGQTGFDFNRDMVIAGQSEFADGSINEAVLLGISLTDPDFRSLGNGGKIRALNAADVQFRQITGDVELSHNIVSHDAVAGTIVFDLKLPTWNPHVDFPVRILYGANLPPSIGIKTGLTVGLTASSNLITPAGWPYPQSNLYAKLNFNGPIKRYAAATSTTEGSDQWPCSEDSAGRLLFVPCDGPGFNNPVNNPPLDPEWMVSRVTGTPDANGAGLTGVDVNTMRDGAMRKKPQAILAFGTSNIAVWWTWLVFDGGANPAAQRGRTHVAISTDNGATVDLNLALDDYLFRYLDNEELSVWGALQLGAGYDAAGGIDNDYIYVYLTNNRQHGTGAWNDPPPNGHDGGTQFVARVRWKGGTATVSDVGERSKYEPMTAFSAGVPTWGTAGDFTVTMEPAFIDPNGMALFFQPQWHSAINKFVASYIHCDNDDEGIAHQGIAVAISDNPFDKNGWTMIGYGQDLDKGNSLEVDYYMTAMAPSRWNDGTNMHFALSTFNTAGPTNPGDNLIVTRVALTAL